VIDHDGPVAPWRQIHAILKARIDSGEYPPGGRLPSIVTMAQDFGVALTTARKALDALKEDGLVVTSPMGTFVAKK
jgi:GntR family transcriptional regulator